jgi:prolyl oligopeptidase
MTDEYQWLEDIESEESLSWVKEQSDKTLKHFKKIPFFAEAYNKTLAMLNDKERMTLPYVYNGEVHDFWRDEKNIRGLWRKTSLNSYITGNPEWVEVLDIDDLATKEGRNWVRRGIGYGVEFSPDKKRAMIALSDGGKDAAVYREFDFDSNSFIEDGFYIPEAKSTVTWIDNDTLVVGTNFDDNSLTEGGYPRVIKKLGRGQSLDSATTIMDVDKSHMGVWVFNRVIDGDHVVIINDNIDFHEAKYYLYRKDRMIEVCLPTNISIKGVLGNQICFYARDDMEIASTKVVSGSIFSIDYSEVLNGLISNVNIMFVPTDTEVAEFYGTSILKESVLVTAMKNVKSVLYEYS